MDNYAAAMQLMALDKIIIETEKELSALMQRPVKLRVVMKGMEATSALQWRFIREVIEDVSGLDWEVIKSKNRTGQLPLLRNAYCWIGSKIIGGRSLKTLSEDIGLTNHTSVIHAKQTFQDLIDTNNLEATNLYNAIIEKFKNDSPSNPIGNIQFDSNCRFLRPAATNGNFHRAVIDNDAGTVKRRFIGAVDSG